MKKVFMFLCATLFVFGFIACSEDDNEEGGDNGNNMVFRVSKITIVDHSDPSEGGGEVFTYDKDGRMTCVDYGEGEVINYTYEGNKIMVNYPNDESESYVMTLNDKGYVSNDNEYEFTYDAQGQLINVKENGRIATSLTWKDGNITKIVDEDGCNGVYTYTTNDNKANIDLSSYLGDQIGDGYLPGVYGKMNKKLIATQTYSEDDIVDEIRYEYTFNEQGAVTKVLEYLNEELHRTYTIEYDK